MPLCPKKVMYDPTSDRNNEKNSMYFSANYLKTFPPIFLFKQLAN